MSDGTPNHSRPDGSTADGHDTADASPGKPPAATTRGRDYDETPLIVA